MFQSKFSWIGVAAFFIVLLCMPLGHATMILMEHYFEGGMLNIMAFLLGVLGLGLTVWGMRIKSDNTATLLGFFGGLLVWTGWIEFLYVYFASKLNIAPLMENGEVVTKPEYLLLMSSVGFWSIIMLFYIARLRSGCSFYCWIQSKLRIASKEQAAQTGGNKSITTFMETNMLLWSCYLLLMFAYDETFLGDRHPMTITIAMGCLVWSVWLFVRLIQIKSMGKAIRYALPTVIIFWTFVEVMGRIGLLKEIWVEPTAYKTEMIVMAITLFAIIVGFIFAKRAQASKETREYNINQ